MSAPPPLHGRLVSAVAIEDGRVQLTIHPGTRDGVASGAKAELWSGGAPIADSSFTILSASERESWSVVRMSIDVVATCDDVVITF